MRNLGTIHQRNQYKAEIEKFDAHGAKKDRVCLINIVDTENKVICDHVWVDIGPWLTKKRLIIGDHFTFTAVPIKYVKRNRHTTNQLEVDITLADVEDVKKVTWQFMFPCKEDGKKEEH